MINRLKNSLMLWKNKAKLRREENKNLQKRVEESRQSRDGWKRKYEAMVEENKRLKEELKKN